MKVHRVTRRAWRERLLTLPWYPTYAAPGKPERVVSESAAKSASHHMRT